MLKTEGKSKRPIALQSSFEQHLLWSNLSSRVPGVTIGEKSHTHTKFKGEWTFQFDSVTHPATTTHRAMGPEERARIGVGDGMVRLSVGLEDPDDLTHDLGQALGRACGGGR